MRVTLGTTVIAAGTAGGQPARLTGGTGSKSVQVSPRIRAKSPGLFTRGNRTYTYSVEATYEYADANAAQAAVITLQRDAFDASGNLVFGEGASAVTVGPAEVRAADLVDWVGAGVIMRYEIIAIEKETQP